jgi:hypothetical protein
MKLPLPVIVLVGGYLGSGKTTILLEAARILQQRNRRVALITNDQGGALVDTRMAVAAGAATEEIAGGCFCCRFSDFIGATDRLSAFRPDVILAEPVGSCIDISATVLQPLKRFYAESFRIAPFTVLVDPGRARELLARHPDDYAAYLFRNQIAEADLVCFSKADLYTDFPELPGALPARLSAHAGVGVQEWLAGVLSGSRAAGSRILDVDYDAYAAAEAALGWLNARARLRLDHPLSAPEIAGPFLDDLAARLLQASAELAHLKVLDDTSAGYVKASLCDAAGEPILEGALTASPAGDHELLVNLRARSAPEVLESIVREALQKLPGSLEILELEAFRPARPRPEHRLS